MEKKIKKRHKLEGGSIRFEYQDERGNVQTATFSGRYERVVKYLHSVGNRGATVWDATYSEYRLRYITQIIHVIRADMGFGYNFITTELEEPEGASSPIARYRITPSLKIVAESEEHND